MTTGTLIILAASIIAALVAGFFIAKAVLGSQQKDYEAEAKSKADEIIKEAREKGEIVKKEKIFEAREKFLQLKADHEKEINQKNKSLQSNLSKLKEKEQDLNKRLDQLKNKERENTRLQEDILKRKEALEMKQEEVDRTHRLQVEQLEKIAGLSADDAKKQMIESLKEEAKTEAKSYIQNIMDEAKASATRESRKIILQTIQRVATEQAIDNSVSVFNIESDEVKGRIIGREGRNIRALEAATGVEIIVDDTPEAIVISGFDAVRREIARLALHRLVTDGRIHPARIEEVVAKTKKDIEEEIFEIGEKTLIDLGIHGMKRELIRLIGRMRYRSSYGQNLLQHSREVANFCAVMANELGLDPKLAKRAGLLHDIGKVMEEDYELPHALAGAKIAEKLGEHPAVVNAIGAHHDEIEMTDPISPIIQVCDAISGARPGARREVFESYVQRLNDLERIAMSYEGVQKSYAIQAGRELRVIVESEKVSDSDADRLSFDISSKIQEEMTYPGQVKVTVIREKRAVSFAK